MRKRIWLLALVPLLAACGSTKYRAEPVVGPNDQRGTDMPDYDDADAIADQDCFRIKIWHDSGFSINDKNVGIACIVEPSK